MIYRPKRPKGPPKMETGTEITINKVTYIIEKHETPESARAEGHIATADMLAYQTAEMIFLRRPRGNKIYMVKRFFHSGLKDWQYSTVTPLI